MLHRLHLNGAAGSAAGTPIALHRVCTVHGAIDGKVIGETNMLWTLIVVLVLLWVVGFAFDVLGALIHFLLLGALVLFILRIVRGRRTLVG